MTSYRTFSFEPKVRRRTRGRGRGLTDSTRNLIAAAAIVGMLVSVAWWNVSAQRQDYRIARGRDTLCLLHAEPPTAMLLLLDETDSLAGDAGSRFTGLIRSLQTRLPKNGRLSVVPFDGDLGRSLKTEFDICSPGTGAQADQMSEGRLKLQRNYETRFQRPLDAVAAKLQAPHHSAYSPIAEQIERAVNDPAIPWHGTSRELIVMTDGLEHNPGSQVYAGKPIVLPPVTRGLLLGVTVDYFELTNPKHAALQTSATRAAWKDWFEASGATVHMYAPGYPTPPGSGAVG